MPFRSAREVVEEARERRAAGEDGLAHASGPRSHSEVVAPNQQSRAGVRLVADHGDPPRARDHVLPGADLRAGVDPGSPAPKTSAESTRRSRRSVNPASRCSYDAAPAGGSKRSTSRTRHRIVPRSTSGSGMWTRTSAVGSSLGPMSSSRVVPAAMGGGRREDVAGRGTREGDRRAEHVGGGDPERGVDAERLLRQRRAGRRRSDEHRPAADVHRDRLVRADARVDHPQEHGVLGNVDAVGQEQRPERDVHRRDAVRQVDDPDGRDRRDHAVTDADEVVLQAEVGQEEDRSGHWTGRVRPLRGGRRAPPGGRGRSRGTRRGAGGTATT